MPAAPSEAGSKSATPEGEYEERLATYGVSLESVNPVTDDELVPMSEFSDPSTLIAALEERFIQGAGAVAGLRSRSIESQRSFATAAALAISPFLTGDLDQLLDHVALLGGTLPVGDDQWRTLRFGWTYNQDRMDILGVAPMRAGVVAAIANTQGDDGFEYMREALRIGMKNPVGHMTGTELRFPDVKKWETMRPAPDAFLARVPVQLKVAKTGEVVLGVIGMVMVFETSSGRWQPALIYFTHDDPKQPRFHSSVEADQYLKDSPGNLHMQ